MDLLPWRPLQGPDRSAVAGLARACLAGTEAGFLAGEGTGWIAQAGVVPRARGRGVGAALMTEGIRRMRAAGETTITLNVNVNNPHAAALYRRLGFTRTGGRARYRRPA